MGAGPSIAVAAEAASSEGSCVISSVRAGIWVKAAEGGAETGDGLGGPLCVEDRTGEGQSCGRVGREVGV